MIKKCTLVLLAAGILGSCSMAPTYVRPDAPVENRFPGNTDSSTKTPASEIGWNEFFREPRLKALIAAAIENNRDLRLAALNIEEARALYNVQWADRLPTFQVEGETSRARSVSTSSPGMVTSGNYTVGLGLAAFELDFFGRVKSLTDAALAQYLATEEAQRSVYISLVSEVAKTYLTERAQTKQIELAKKSYESYKHSYELMQKRYEVGASSALELRQYETLMQSALVSLSTLERQRAQTENALLILTGGKQIKDLPPPHDLSEDDILQDIPAGLPSDLLTNRPDIRQYEQLLKAANANIGAARAAFFPRITLTAFAGTASSSLSGLFDAGTAAWTFTPQLTLPIFDAGRNMANLDLAEARKNIAIVNYEKAIQTAFREVADALTARDWLNEQVKAQAAVLNSETERLKLSEARYNNGIASSLEVFDAQRQQFAAEQSLVDARLTRLINAVELYRSLGGGLTDSGVAKTDVQKEQPVQQPKESA
ncbi:efflux transporter outer membrane subunit [Oxalobacter aliiformigenes]|uniref:efflux transporter outer membrane subunit n=1 Tax=Oxalobacter aliiformigenes TaxID=2946593 RepID=UPI0022AFE4C3|nr:efflux transporter outer membrane subunit [Oxalobacter aliiformigenes]MCZ4065082.1 efflux transporter outer membrane subunit [Oxalobacter aliiformigenes]WAV99345.1 efflux transporter outer membrane subunit [Oxalobacter aliiformigenes]